LVSFILASFPLISFYALNLPNLTHLILFIIAGQQPYPGYPPSNSPYQPQRMFTS
jgi:hypothetical protein